MRIPLNKILFIGLCFCFSIAIAQKKLPEIGIVAAIENDSLLHAYGYTCLVEATPKLLSPRNVSDEQFGEYKQKIKTAPMPLLACNVLVPGDLKLVGPSVNEDALLAYLEEVFKRGKDAGIPMFTWGSGGARRIPDNFDREKAKNQFITLARKVAELAAKYNIILALENLNSTETNFITTVEEALEIVKAVDHKNLRLCVDIYHMLMENESPEVIRKTAPYTIYCEVAEKSGRTPPGVNGQDFIPYLTELKNIGYKGKIVIECRWQDVIAQGKDAYNYLHQQIQVAYNQ